jgi:hypothetical protein
MKTSHLKTVLTIMLCVLILGIAYFSLFKRATKSHKNIPAATDTNPVNTSVKPSKTNSNESSITDIFYGTLVSVVQEKKDSSDPGKRYNVKITNDGFHPQKGDALGAVVVNDPIGNFKGRIGLSYTFNTYYDAAHDWYTIAAPYVGGNQ